MSLKRMDRINEEVKKVLSEIIREMKDPRISPMTTIVMVEVTKDYKYAKVKVSVYDEDDFVRTETVKALNYAKGFIAHELGNRMDIRHLPDLKFMLDTSIEYSVHISGILDDLARQRQEKGVTDETDSAEE